MSGMKIDWLYFWQNHTFIVEHCQLGKQKVTVAHAIKGAGSRLMAVSIDPKGCSVTLLHHSSVTIVTVTVSTLPPSRGTSLSAALIRSNVITSGRYNKYNKTFKSCGHLFEAEYSLSEEI